MGSRKEHEHDEDLVFFGKISASVSHDINNCLAIINENAGLLEDFSLMAEQGMPLDPGRLKGVSEKIRKYVRRANELVKHMNRLAHSSDRPVQKTDLGQILLLMCALTERFAVMQEVRLQPILPEHFVKVVTKPFRLNHLLWRCIDHAFHNSGKGQTIDLTLNQKSDGARITFQPVGKHDLSIKELLSHSDSVQDLLDELGASLNANIEKGELILDLPERLEAIKKT